MALGLAALLALALAGQARLSFVGTDESGSGQPGREVVAIGITVMVYGAVGLIVKMDDVGLRLAEKDSKGAAKFGRGLVKAMPKVLTALSVIGTAAMLNAATAAKRFTDYSSESGI